MQTHHERGIALVLALFLMAALSVLGASLMFLSQTETYASMNYRMMSQARYAAEAGVQRTANFLVDPAQYTVPSATGADSLANYDRTVSPVTYLGQPVVLSSTAASSNYPIAAVKTAFSAVAAGTIHTAAGTNQDVSLTYASSATLISMQQFNGYGGTGSVVQTWEITVDGSLTNSPKAIVEVSARVETPKVPANQFAAFATDNQCDAILLKGNTTVDSYDSSVAPPGDLVKSGPLKGTCTAVAPATTCSTEGSGGDLGSNGNIDIVGSVDVYGNVVTPREGAGACTAGNVVGLTGMVHGQQVKAPGAITFPPPVFPVTPPTTPAPLTAATLAGGSPAGATACTSLGLTIGTNCSVSGSTITVNGHGANLLLPNVVVDSGITLLLTGANTPGQTIDINSLTGSGAVETVIDNTLGDQSVILRVAGRNADGTEMTTLPFDLSTMTWKQNATAKSYDASSLQIVYGGTQEIAMQGGNSQSAATIYAPNATFNLKGTQDFFGSILAKKVLNNGNTTIHYDRRLQRDFDMAGQPMMGTFSWKKS